MINSPKPPDEGQTISSFEVQMQIFNKLLNMEREMKDMKEAFQTLSQTLAINMKQNLDMMKHIDEYIGEQMSYRLYRQNLEENNIQLQLKQKELELKFLQQKYDDLSTEKQEDDAESRDLKLERERMKLEVETLRKNLEALQENKHSTKDRIPTLKVQSPQEMSKELKDAIFLTAIRTLTATTVVGIIAFFVWLIRFYIENTPK
jgi:myosin heavy subunit